MADMIKFFKGLEASLPATGVNGALYVTTDEGAIYLGTGTGMKRLGDFVQVDKVESLPEKAHESCLYYCVAENILAKWNGTEWKQINKQPTAEEMKTLLGLGSLAYKSEVAEADLNTDLAAKINAASGAQHSHDNKGVLDGITSEKVSAWDNAEKNAKDHADGLNTAMNTRVEALEAIDHEHSNKSLLDTYTQTEADLADAVAKKHAHTFVESELNKIAAGDVAKWNGVVADHLVAADKTELVDSIGDVSTALENYKTSNNEALAGVKATAEAAATKEYTDAELAKKVAKTDYEADKATFATKTDIAKLAGVSEGANKVEASETNGNIKIDGVETVVYTHPDKHAISDVTGLQDALDAKVAQSAYDADKATFATKTELGNVDAKFANYTTTTAQQAIDAEQDRRLGVIEGDYVKSADIADFETKDNVKKVADDLAAEVKARGEADTALEERIADLEANFGDGEGTVEAQIAAAVAAEAEIARAAEKANADDIDALEGRMDTAEGKIADLEAASTTHAIKTEVEAALALKADKSALEATDKTLAEVKTTVDNFFAEDAAINDTIDTLKEIANYIATDKEGAADITARVGALEGKVDVDKVSEAIDADVSAAIEAEVARADGAYDKKGDAAAAQAAAEAKAAELDSALKTELQGEIDSDVAAAEARIDAKYEEKGVAQGIVDGLKLSETYEPIGAESRAIAAAKTETENQVKALADTVYTQAEVDALISAAHTWGEF